MPSHGGTDQSASSDQESPPTVDELDQQFDSFRVRIPLVGNRRTRSAMIESVNEPIDAEYDQDTGHDHIRWSNDDNLNIIPRCLTSDPFDVVSTTFFKSHPEHCINDKIVDFIRDFGLMGLMNKNMVDKKDSSLGSKHLPTKRTYSQMDGSKTPAGVQKSSFVQPGMTYILNNNDQISTELKFTELFKDNLKVKGTIQTGQASLDFVGRVVDFVDNDLRSTNSTKMGIEGSVFSNLLRNTLCFDKDFRKYIGRHKRMNNDDPNWKPFYLDKFGYLKSNGSKTTSLTKSKETKFPNTSIFSKVVNMCGNKGCTYKCLAKWFDLPPFNEFVRTPAPPTPPGGRRKHTSNPENLLVCPECQDLILENFILLKLEVDIEDLLKESSSGESDLKIRNDMRYKRRRRLKPLTSYTAPSGSPAPPAISPPMGQATRPQYYSHDRTRGFIFGTGHQHFMENLRQRDENRSRRIRLLDYLVSRQQWRHDDMPSQFHTRQRSNDEGYSTDSDFSDDEMERNFIIENLGDEEEAFDEEDAEEEENEEDINIDELYDVGLSSGRSRRIENLLFERNLTREQQHHRRGHVLARKLYKNNGNKLKLQIYVSINRLTGELYMIPGNLDRNNWSSEENDGELFEDYQTFLKIYKLFNGLDVGKDDHSKQYKEFKEYVEKNKPAECKRIQKLILLNLITNPNLYMLEPDPKPVPYDVSTPLPVVLSSSILPSMTFPVGKRKNRKHEEEEAEAKDALIHYFNENVHFNYENSKVLKFSPNYSNRLNLFGSFYSFSYS
ncbi:hypothetical protein OGAPHI_003672 [Ogataea philodendri]|uniref:Uncharacterized protein n=1 Tax=Ogataea philodendri TaxID=1378263 RepID=A0A9P8P5U0_9ASCO|nr:uncharacterized protein OGAPHI_003672 [Ogataea philodendri]KAH3665487.1 hypothetical protein OGAPHI_003672 [Ogataea philodendri]